MALLNVSWKIGNLLLPFADFLYILQIEEYSSRRLLRWLPRFFFRRNFQVRQRLVWTTRVQITCVFSIAIWIIGLITILIFSTSNLFFIFLLAVCFLCVPVAVFIANTLLITPFSLVHTFKRTQGGNRIKAFKKNGKVVAIIGSFGKTTTKSFLEQVTQYNFRVQTTPGNTNTGSGIATWLLGGVKPHTNLLLIEAEGYSGRQYRQIGNMIHADIIVITCIGDQHLERFGSQENLARALGEFVKITSKDATVVCTQRTKDALAKEALDARNVHIVANGDENRALAQECARILHIPENIIADTMLKLELPERRQKPSLMYGYEAIDDSYNISWTTAKAGIAAAKDRAQKTGKKLLVVTAGIMELGPGHQDTNKHLGELLAREADFSVVLGTIFSHDVVHGLGTAPHKIVPSLTAFLQEAHNVFSPNEWFLLMQPEMHDLYY